VNSTQDLLEFFSSAVQSATAYPVYLNLAPKAAPSPHIRISEFDNEMGKTFNDALDNELETLYVQLDIFYTAGSANSVRFEAEKIYKAIQHYRDPSRDAEICVQDTDTMELEDDYYHFFLTAKIEGASTQIFAVLGGGDMFELGTEVADQYIVTEDGYYIGGVYTLWAFVTEEGYYLSAD
jgi:hypothetical protein